MRPTSVSTCPSPHLSPITSQIRKTLLLGVALMGTAVGGLHGQGSGTFGDWNYNGNDDWGDVTRWISADPAGTYPSGVGATAVVVQDISSSTRIISLQDTAGVGLDIVLGTLILGDTNNSNAFQIGSVSSGGTLTFDNDGALNHFGTTGALLDHQYYSSAQGSATTANPFKQSNSSDRIDAKVFLNDDLTILASRSIAFNNAWTGNGNDITLTGLNTNRIYWLNNGSTQVGTLSGVNNLNIYNGEARFEGTSGVAGSQHIGATTINLGDGFSTTGGNAAFDGFLRVFPRLYLVNTETTQTADLNMDGAWLISDLGTVATLNGDGIDIWSGTITLSGDGTTNIFDVNDGGTAEVHYVSGAIEGSGGFSKINNGSLNLKAKNTLSGDVYIQRGAPGGTGLTGKGAVVLSGANGALTDVSSVTISRDGSLYLDNASANNLDRLNDDASILLRGQGRIRVTQQSGIAASETMGDLRIATGAGRIEFDLHDTAPAGMNLTFASLTRDKGAIAQFQVLDNVPGTLGASGSAHVYITDGGTGLTKKGGNGGNGATNQSLVVGVFGGVNNVADHFMTFDKVNTKELRPLEIDEYLSSRSLGHTLSVATLTGNDPLNPYNKNLNIDFDTEGLDPDNDWYGVRPIRLTESVAVNSLRFGTNTPNASDNSNNNNELGSALVLDPGTVLYLGDSQAATTGLATNTDGSGMILFGRDIYGTAPDSNQFIVGGALEFGSREAIIVNESGNNAYIRSEIRGSGGMTKAGANTVYMDGANSYTGETNVAEGVLVVRQAAALGNSSQVNIEGNGQLYLEYGSNVVSGATTATPPTLFIGAIDGSRQVLYSNSANNTWGGDIIVDGLDELGKWVFTPYIGTNALATLNVNGDIYSNELANPINRDTSLNDARSLQIVFNSAGGVVNLNGQVSDNAMGVGGGGAGITSDTENQLLRVTISSSNEGVVNVRQQWNAAGRINLQQGILRYEGEGNFYTDDAAAALMANTSGQSTGNGMSGIRLGASNNATYNTLIVLTKDGQVLNAPRIDTGGDGTNNYNGLGNNTLAGTNTSGVVTFGTGTDRYLFGSTNATNAHIRDLSVYAAGGGTVNLNYILEDQDGDVHTSLTKLGRGTVNFNGANYGASARDGTVEQITLSGGLLRLTGYGSHTGRRVDDGAMIVFAGGGIEMDGVGSVANETENLTGTAVTGSSAMQAGKTIINAGGTDVIVTSTAGRTTTLNIGSANIALVRNTGGSLNFLQNDNGGSAVISFNGSGVTAGSSATDFDSFVGGYATFSSTPGTVTEWAGLNSAFRVGAFTGLSMDSYGAGVHTDVVTGSGMGSQAETLRFNTDGAGLDFSGGIFSVDGGGILATSNLVTNTVLTNGTLTRTGGGDLVVHNYAVGDFEIQTGIANNGGNAVSLAIAGTGNTILSGVNTYTGSTYFNGGTVTISSESNLGAVPGAATADNLYFNGGILHTTGDITLSQNRGVTLGGNGGEIRVDAGTTLTIGGMFASEPNLTPNYASNPAVGRIDKSGAGTLVLGSLTNAHNGLTEIKEGTLKWQPSEIVTSNTLNIFGSTNAFLDSTILRSGATLEFAPRTAASNSSVSVTINEWFTLEGGSRMDFSLFNDATNGFSDARYNFRGVISLDAKGAAGTPAGNVTFNVLRREVAFGDAGGYLTGDGGITKIGNGVMYFRENNPEWNGQLVHNEGTVEVYSSGMALGSGTLPILLGHNLAAELTGEAESGNNPANLYIRDENSFRDEVIVTQDVIVRADGGAGSQTKRIGARHLSHEDVASWNGTLTLNDNVEFFYQDDARNSTDQFNASSSTASANTRNDIRSIGAATNAEVVYVNFNGSIIGGKNITTNVSQSGNGNATNGSITAPFDDLVLLPVFGLNGDNSAWTGNLVMGNSTSDVDRNHTISIGNAKGISAANAVTMHNNAVFRVSGNDVTIGSLSNPAGINTIGSYIENAAIAAGSLTIVQNTDVTLGVVFRDGVNFQALQPGQVDASLSLVKAGTGTLEMTRGNSYSGFTALNNGTLKLSYGADGSMLSDTAVLRLNGGVLELAGTVAHQEVVGSTILDGAVSIIRSSGNSVIHLNALARISGTLSISEDNIATTDTINNPLTGIIGGWATVGGSWAVNSTNAADGALVGLTTFADVDRLGGVIADSANANVRIIEAGTSGNVTLAGTGVTTINTLLQGADGGPAIVDVGAGNTLRIASGGVLLPEGSASLSIIGGELTAGTGADSARLLLQNQNAFADLTVGSVIVNNGSGIVGLTTSGPGTTVLTGANTYTGSTLVTSGTLQIGDGGTTGNLGSGDLIINSSGTLAFNRSDAGLVITQEITGQGTVLQSGSGTTTLGAASAVNDITFVMGNGTLAAGVDQAINTTSALVFGSSDGATTVGTLDLTNASATAGGLRVQTNTTAVNNLLIGAGETLTLNGDVVIGVSLANATDTRLTMSGGGNLVVNNPSGVFQIGGATGDVNGNRVVLDMSGLANFTADLGTGGVFRVGDNNANSSGGGTAPATTTLAVNSTITAGTFGVGDRQGIGSNSLSTLKLGSGTTILNVDELNVGDRGQRGSGLLQFNTSEGTLRVRGSDGVSRTNVNVVASTAGTGYMLNGTIDLTGHEADLYIGIMEIGRRSTGTGGATTSFSFDQGTLDVTSILMGRKLAGGGTAAVTSTLNIGGGTVRIGSGGIVMAENKGTEASKSSAVVNITGGDITMDGDILKVGATGALATATATFNFSDATLNMQGHVIGSADQPIDELTFSSGTLMNIGQINGGGGLVAAGTGGVLVLDGNNTYTGGTTVNNGTLSVAATGNTGFGDVAINTGATLTGSGLIRGTTTVANGASVIPGTGSSPASLTWDSGADLNFDTGSSASFVLGSSSGISDQLVGTGTITLDEGAMFTVTGWDGSYTPTAGDTWQLLDWTTITGDFNVGANLRDSGNGGGDLYLPSLDFGYYWDVSNFMTNGTIAVVIPEPGRAGLLLLGAFALLGRRRRPAKKAAGN